MSSKKPTDDERANEDWPSKELLETALRKWLEDPTVAITEFTSKVATNKGDNYTSTMYRVVIKCEQKKDPLSMVIKRVTLVGPSAGIIVNSTAFEREVLMLKTVLPELLAMMRKAIPEVEPFGPGYIYSTHGVLAMEDLQQGGFRIADRRLGLDLNHCSLVVRTLARYHASTVLVLESKSFDVSVIRKCIMQEPSFQTELKKHFVGMLTALSDELKTFDGLEKYSAKVAALAEQDFLSLLLKSLEDLEVDNFPVITHGDLWTNNMMFRYSSSGVPDAVRFVDWQITFITSPCVDLQYFLVTSSNEAVRTEHFDKLIEEYHVTLCETMADLKCSTRPPTLENLRKEFDKCTYFGILAAFTVLPIVLEEAGMYDFDDVVETGKPQNALFRGKPFRKALEWYLPIFESKGFL